MTNYGQVIDRWIGIHDGIGSQRSIRSSNCYFRDREIFSYGEHFPLARAVKDRKGATRLWLLNGDRWRGGGWSSTSGQQSDLVSKLSDRPTVTIPFPALNAAGIDRDSVVLIQETAARSETIEHVFYEQPEGTTWHVEDVHEYVELTLNELQAKYDERFASEHESWETTVGYYRRSLAEDEVAEGELSKWVGYLASKLEREPVRRIAAPAPTENSTTDVWAIHGDYHERHEYRVVGTVDVLRRRGFGNRPGDAVKVEQLDDGRIRYSWKTYRHWLGESVIRADVRWTKLLRCSVCKGTGIDPAFPEFVEGRRNWSHPCVKCRADGGVHKNFKRTSVYLSGFDMNESTPSYFFCELPPGSNPTTVAEAYEILKPDTVKMAEGMGREVLRQGDIYAIPTIQLDKRALRKQGARFEKRGVLLNQNHVATEVAYMPDGTTLARGTLTHAPAFRRPDHKRVKLVGGGWHIIVKNTVPVTV